MSPSTLSRVNSALSWVPAAPGKTTVLNILGGMDSCDEGLVLLDGREVSGMSEKELTDYRRHDVGFVFQFYNWCKT